MHKGQPESAPLEEKLETQKAPKSSLPSFVMTPGARSWQMLPCYKWDETKQRDYNSGGATGNCSTFEDRYDITAGATCPFRLPLSDTGIVKTSRMCEPLQGENRVSRRGWAPSFLGGLWSCEGTVRQGWGAICGKQMSVEMWWLSPLLCPQPHRVPWLPASGSRSQRQIKAAFFHSWLKGQAAIVFMSCGH